MRKSASFWLLLAPCAVVFVACSDDAASNGSDDGGAPLADGGHPTTLPDGAPAPPDTTLDGGGTPGTPGASGCTAINVASTASDEAIAWSDADCKPRTTTLAHAGYASKFGYEADGKTRNCPGSNGTWKGFGFIVTHYGSTAATTNGNSAKYTTILKGAHHSIHEHKWRINPGGAVDVTAHWFFATGRAHPLYSITYDATPAGANKVNADTRSPYGDIWFDDGKGGVVDGVGWGDKYQLVTTGNGPVNTGGTSYTYTWDYTKPNVVPYVIEWANAADAEMGLVATQSWEDDEQGGDYGSKALSGSWGKTGTTMPTDYLWPYQLNQYELPFTNNSHRMAWGASYGAVGQSSYKAFDKTLVGYPYQSYAVYVVLGKHSAKAVAAQVAEIEAVLGTKVSASRGTVATDGIGGVARTDKAPYKPVGFDPVYGAWTFDAAGDALTATIDVGSGSLKNPVIVLRNYNAATPPKTVTYAGKTLAADDGYFATVDAGGKRLFVTLNVLVGGAGVLTIE